jgi:hypothetical protein
VIGSIGKEVGRKEEEKLTFFRLAISFNKYCLTSYQRNFGFVPRLYTCATAFTLDFPVVSSLTKKPIQLSPSFATELSE